MSTRRSLAIAGLSCALLGAWGAAAFLRETRGGEAGGAAANRAAASATDVDPPRDDSRGGGDASNDASRRRELTPTVTAFDPRLEWPDVAMLRRIEQRGRALFGGIVYAPDGSPCPGATIFCNRETIATSDDHGAWRADVSRPSNRDLDGGLEMDPQPAPAFLLAAHKEGVGFAEAAADAVSRRVDLHLHGGFAFRGTVIDNDDLRPVRAAELEARVRAIVERVRADGRGDFSFPSLPSGNLELSGRAPGYDSNGSFSYNFDRGRDVTITFRLTKAYRLRGQFAPWPAPGVTQKSAAVVLTPRSPHGGSPAPTLEGAVAADGSFDVSLPVCPACLVELAVGGRVIWQADLDVNEEKHDVDLGRIELTLTAGLTGRVAVPDGGMRSAVEISAVVSAEGGRSVALRRPIAADGSFHLELLQAGRATASVYVDGDWVASLRGASGLSEEEHGGGGVILAPGEMRDVGVITLERFIVFGTVRDGRGEPVALARILQVERREGLAGRILGFQVIEGDEDGRFHFMMDEFGRPSRRIALDVRARGFAPVRVDVEFPEGATSVRRDVVLADGVVLRGKLLDVAGAPLHAASVRAEPVGEAGDSPHDRAAHERAAYDVTQADGSFEIRGLDSGQWKIYAIPRGGPMVRFTKIHPDQGPITLRMADGEPVAMPSLPK